ncbi:MAG: tetratricopeptide repeat protein [Vampirovibrionales bacterium]|nr:tetratricopeptide repeat protein [Vampirovibrionales bacterium]
MPSASFIAVSVALLVALVFAGCQPASQLANDPEGVLDRKPVAELNLKAQALLQAGDAKAAIARLESALDLAPNDPGTLYNLALSYEQSGESARSIALFEQLLQLNAPGIPKLNVHKSLGVLYEEQAARALKGELGTPAGELNTSASQDNGEALTQAKTQPKAGKPDLAAAEAAYKKAIAHYTQAADLGGPETDLLRQQVVDIEAELAKGLKPQAIE